MKILEVDNVRLQFGGLVAVSNVSFSQKKGEILAVIGPNGAGKTSLFNVITGLYSPTSGSIKFCGKPLQNLPTALQNCFAFISVLLFAFSFVIAINCQELWQLMVVDRYVYQEAFSYLEAIKAGVFHVSSLSIWWSLVPFFAALFFAVAALHKFKQAAQTSPLVAARAGLARTFQNLRLMGAASVSENIRSVISAEKRPGILASILRLPNSRKFENYVSDEVDKVLFQLALSSYAQTRTDSLPYGLQRRVEIARALATKPKLLLLDEPAAGLNPSESQELLALVKEIAVSGITVLLIEHDMSVVMALSDRIVVLHHGEKIAEGTPDEIRQNPQVIKAYLGSTAVSTTDTI